MNKILIIFILFCNSLMGQIYIPYENEIDTSKIKTIVEQADEIPNLLSLIVIKNNNVIFENYFNGNEDGFMNNIQSITKSIVASLVGVGISRGYLSSVDEQISIHFKFRDPKANKITLKNLLTMTSGLEWNEAGEFVNWLKAKSQIGYLMEKTFSENEFGMFNYNSASSHMVSSILGMQYKSDVQTFALHHLFAPLEITKANWSKDNNGFYMGATGLSLTPFDLAKIGITVLQNGNWKGLQIFPEAWVEEMLTPYTEVESSWSHLENIHYGYQWWIADINKTKVMFAWGYAGQFLFLFPEYNSLIVTTSKWQVDVDEALDTEEEIFELIYEQLLPLLKN